MPQVMYSFELGLAELSQAMLEGRAPRTWQLEGATEDAGTLEALAALVREHADAEDAVEAGRLFLEAAGWLRGRDDAQRRPICTPDALGDHLASTRARARRGRGAGGDAGRGRVIGEATDRAARFRA